MVSSATTRPPLVRPSRSVLGGVCAALSTHLGWPVRRVRIIFAIASLVLGAGVLLYAWLWALTPLAGTGDEGESVRRTVPTSAILLAAGTVATLFAIGAANSGGDGFTPAVLTIVLVGGAVAWSLTLDRVDDARTTRYAVVVRVLSIIVLLATGALLLSANGGHPSAITAVLAIGMLVLGFGVMVAPLVVTLWTDLMAERAGRVRDEQRAEIAAHLHDSVLQTLALIQNRAGASSEVARLARAQERELRDWLFAGETPTAEDLISELRDIAATIEFEYPARLDVVTVGEPGLTSPALISAAREAMLNAARHAGGEVSVYIESSASAVDVYVRDRGPGVDLDSLPDDRLGVRESIIGRMLRAGGTATVSPGAGGIGTEVHLHLEATDD